MLNLNLKHTLKDSHARRKAQYKPVGLSCKPGHCDFNFCVLYAIESLSCLSSLSGCDVDVLWPNGYDNNNNNPICKAPECQKTSVVGWIGMPLGTDVGVSQGHIVLDGDPAPLSQKGHRSPHFSVHVYCGPTVAHLSYCWALCIV